jgi:2-polyprenyl-6-methoxyphenol hydroxylase-like FAD-dependent oxidoreductase
MNQAPREVDYVVIGAGMCGTTLAHFLRDDREVVVLDPRPGGYKIGESVIPEQFHHPELRALLDDIRKLPSYSTKTGSVFIAGKDAASFPLPPHGCEAAMHVARYELEPLLHRKWNTPIHKERVRDVDAPNRLVYTDKGVWKARELILDCSGPAMVVARKCGQIDELYPTYARWTYFDIVDCDESRFWDHVKREGYSYKRFDVPNGRFMDAGEDPHWSLETQTLLSQVARGVWTWQIPLYNHRLLSFGVVTRTDRIDAEAYYQLVAKHHAPHFKLRRRPHDPKSALNRMHVRARFAHRARQIATRDYVLCGDAAAFGDPVYSVGAGMAVNKAIELAAILNEGTWDSPTCERWCVEYNDLVDRALEAFDVWYRGDLMTSEKSALNVQQNFLEGSAFQVGIATHYGRVLKDAGAPEVVEGPGGRGRHYVDPGESPLTDETAALLGLGPDTQLAGWTLVAAYRTPTEVQQRWQAEGKPELHINTSFRPDVVRYYKRVGNVSLSFMNLWDGPYPMCDRTRALFDALEARIEARRDDWHAWGETLFADTLADADTTRARWAEEAPA